MSQPKLHTCEFIEVTDLVPKHWAEWFWSAISENAPFSWGDNNRTLVTASDFARHCEDALLWPVDDGVISQRVCDNFLKKLQALGETYIDLEN